MSDKLEKCPFCGGEVKARKSEFFKTPLMFFDCKECGATVSFNSTICNLGASAGDYTPSILAFNSRAERTCEGCAHNDKTDNGDWCEMCSRCHPDLYEPKVVE